MRIYFAFFLLAVSIHTAYRSQKFSKLDGLDQFKQVPAVLSNLPQFYYHIRFAQNFEQYEYFCPHIVQELERLTTVDRLYFALKVIKELRCKLHPQALSNHINRVRDSAKTVSDFSHIFRMLIMVQTPLEEILEQGCKKLSPFAFKDSARVRRTTGDLSPSFDHTAMMLRDFWECGIISDPFKQFALQLVTSAAQELVDVTKEQSAWPTEDTLYDTMDILVSVLQIKASALSQSRLERVLKFVSTNISNDASVREKNKWNQLLSELEKHKVQIIEAPQVFDFNGCEDTCYLPVVGLPPDTTVTASFDNKERTLRVQKSNVLMGDIAELKQAKEVTFKLTHPEFHVVPSKFQVKIRRENRMLLVRMAVSARQEPDNLLDSDENECGSIGLAGNEGSFLHVGFRLQAEEHFAFVHLEPHNLDFENSAMVHAEFRSDERLHVATLDFSDYETIRPNSGAYNIWLTVGGQRKQCGQITLTFTNLEKSLKDAPTKAAPVELTNVPTFKMDDERFYFAGLYFTVTAVAFAVAYFFVYERVKAGLPQDTPNTFWQSVFLLALGGHVATLFLLLWRYQLIEKAHYVFVQLGLLTYLFARAFIKRHN